jgi:carbon monoxide dehydrogenase subunit G
MDFDNSFTVDAPIGEVWDAMLDVERVAPCVPGASVLEKTGENAYKVGIKVKLGPMSMTYTGNVEIVEADEGEHRAVMSANAREQRGQGTARATVEMRLTERDGGGTEGTMHSDVAISGRAASMGRGVIGDVSAKMISTFADNLAAMLSGARVGEPVAAGVSGNGGSAAPPAPEPPPAAEEESLPLGDIAGAVVAGRLQDPRALAGALLVVAFVSYRLGRRRGARAARYGI